MSAFMIREEPDALVVTIDDPTALNDFRSNSFRNSFYDAVTSHGAKGVALDLGQIDFLSSSGVAILVGLKRRIEDSDGRLVLFAVQPIVRELLNITQLTRYFDFADDEDEARATLRSRSTV
jgi:anti-sigma B factor antagonist